MALATANEDSEFCNSYKVEDPRSNFVLVSSNSNLSQDELVRYSRHLSLPEVGIEGQRKLKSAKVLVVGAGGLGCPVARG